MYTNKFIEEVIQYKKDNHLSNIKVAKHFGVNRKTIDRWAKDKRPHEAKHKLINHANKHKRNAKDIINKALVLIDDGKTPKEVVNILSLTDVSVLYTWIKHRNSKEYTLKNCKVTNTRLHIALCEETMKIKGVDIDKLSTKDKATIIQSISKTKKYSISQLCKGFNLKRSSYYYNVNSVINYDKYSELRLQIKKIFYDLNSTRGYRAITQYLRRLENPIIVSEKVVLRIMKEENLHVIYNKRKRHYNSYEGETTVAPNNLVKRNFTADKPNQLWLTDVTEMKVSDKKVYLSPVIDCYDGKIISYEISNSPDAKMANNMLLKAIGTLKHNERPVCHSDRGCHYRWIGWINICDKYKITRSMSAKGCSPDNAACEGFFGRLKNEFYYYRDWSNITYEDFVIELNEYIDYYNKYRLKENLGWMSPDEYRIKNGYAA